MIAAGRRSKYLSISRRISSSSTLAVPNVSKAIEVGCATPIAYEIWISSRSASSAATMFFAMWRAA